MTNQKWAGSKQRHTFSQLEPKVYRKNSFKNEHRNLCAKIGQDTAENETSEVACAEQPGHLLPPPEERSVEARVDEVHVHLC